MRVFKWHEFHNDVEAIRRFPHAVFGITSRRARTTVPPHGHEGGSFICLLEGRHHWHGTDGLIHWSVPGAWYYRSPQEVHTHEACPTVIRCIGVNFDPLVLGFPTIPDTEMVDLEDGARIARQIRAEIMEKSPGGDFLLQGLLFELLALFLNSKESMPENTFVRQAATMLSERFSEGLSLEQVAGEVGVHRSHLARLFKKHLGVTVGEYVRDRRLEWAYKQLLANNSKIANLAVEAGFADHAHFCRQFKARYGLSPSMLRQQGSGTI